MTLRSAAFCLFVVGILGLATVATHGRGQDVEKSPETTDEALQKRLALARLEESEPTFLLWKQKAELELEILQAQVEAKKAEIRFRTAEHRARQLAPDLAILTKLDQRFSMPFANETPIEDVLKYIKRHTAGPNDTGIPIYVDPEGMQKAGKTMQSTVALDLEEVPLRISLRLILKQLGLMYAVKDGMLTITAETMSHESR